MWFNGKITTGCSFRFDRFLIPAIAGLIVAHDSSAQTPKSFVAPPPANAFRPDRILVKPVPATSGPALADLRRQFNARLLREYPELGGLQVLTLGSNITVAAALHICRESGLTVYAEPDYLVSAARVPNETNYLNGTQWSLYNWGQLGGALGADIDAAAGWDLAYDASSMCVSVIDSGIRVTHEDLAANLWTNPGEIPGNGIDDDHNGYVDDVHGLNAIDGSGSLADEASHGTHVAGILGAVGDNGMGVAGVAWRVRMMGCKFLNAQFQGSISDAIECIEYSRAHGARIINASWGGQTGSPFFSSALYDAINGLRSAGIILVAAAGNLHLDNDSTNAFYPATFDLDNIISVAATTRDDLLADFSDYGANSVDLGAPGYAVYSCWATADNAYAFDDGTSMAAPHVAAACALAWSLDPNATYRQIIQRVLAGTDPVPGLAGKCRTGGRLNLRKVLEAPRWSSPPVLFIQAYSAGQFQFRVRGDPYSFVEIQTTVNLRDWTSATTNQLPASGTLSYLDDASTMPGRYYRAVLRP